jgi:hypothetical protein
LYRQGFVKRSLQSPACTGLSILRFCLDLSGHGTYEVESYVDSQNIFGGMIRNNWKARLTFDGGDDADSRNWTRNRLLIDGKRMY